MTDHKHRDAIPPPPPDEPACSCNESLCEPCFTQEELYWAARFGLRPGMTNKEARAQLRLVRPPMADDPVHIKGEDIDRWEGDE